LQSCSHSSSTEDYQKIKDVQEENVVNNILCDTLNAIDTVCRDDLEECFSDDDIVMMTVSHMKEMKKFLVRIARGKVDQEALEDFDGIENDVANVKHKKKSIPLMQNNEQKERNVLNMLNSENSHKNYKKEAEEIESAKTFFMISSASFLHIFS
jgi:hypothetical protein